MFLSLLLLFLTAAQESAAPGTGTSLPRILPPPPAAATFAGEKSKVWSSCLRNSHVLRGLMAFN